jgi:ech hydrogenase subunit A
MPTRRVMMIGISGMFLAPFGMLISKWVTLKAFIDYNPVLSVIIAYGSAATLFFWTKWMGKIIQIKHDDHLHSIDEHISTWEWITLGVVAFLTISVCVAFPLVSSRLIEPFIVCLYGMSPTIDRFSMTIIVIIMVGLLIILPMGIFYYAFLDKDYKRVGTYLGGANMTNTTFEGAMLERQRLTFRNYYMENLFGEKKLFVTGNGACRHLHYHHVRSGRRMNLIHDFAHIGIIYIKMAVNLVFAPFVGGLLAGWTVRSPRACRGGGAA